MSVCLALEPCAGDQLAPGRCRASSCPCCHICHTYLPGIAR